MNGKQSGGWGESGQNYDFSLLNLNHILHPVGSFSVNVSVT